MESAWFAYIGYFEQYSQVYLQTSDESEEDFEDQNTYKKKVGVGISTMEKDSWDINTHFINFNLLHNVGVSIIRAQLCKI